MNKTGKMLKKMTFRLVVFSTIFTPTQQFETEAATRVCLPGWAILRQFAHRATVHAFFACIFGSFG
jgi:hypothetical protein